VNISQAFAIVEVAAKHITDEQSDLADPWSMVLSNLTRVESLVHEILDTLERDDQTLPRLAKAFAQLDYNKKKAKLHYLAPIFCNLTQVPRGRELCCHGKYQLLEKLLPFASFEGSVVRRGVILGETVACAKESKRKPGCMFSPGCPVTAGDQLCGIVAWGPACKRPGMPGIFTDIHQVKKFILRAISGKGRISSGDHRKSESKIIPVWHSGLWISR